MQKMPLFCYLTSLEVFLGQNGKGTEKKRARGNDLTWAWTWASTSSPDPLEPAQSLPTEWSCTEWERNLLHLWPLPQMYFRPLKTHFSAVGNSAATFHHKPFPWRPCAEPGSLWIFQPDIFYLSISIRKFSSKVTVMWEEESNSKQGWKTDVLWLFFVVSVCSSKVAGLGGCNKLFQHRKMLWNDKI